MKKLVSFVRDIYIYIYNEDTDLIRQLYSKEDIDIIPQINSKEDIYLIRQLYFKGDTDLIRQIHSKEETDLINQIHSNEDTGLIRQIYYNEYTDLIHQIHTKEDTDLIHQTHSKENTDLIRQIYSNEDTDFIRQIVVNGNTSSSLGSYQYMIQRQKYPISSLQKDKLFTCNAAEDSSLLRCYAVSTGKQLATFQSIMSLQFHSEDHCYLPKDMASRPKPESSQVTCTSSRRQTTLWQSNSPFAATKCDIRLLRDLKHKLQKLPTHAPTMFNILKFEMLY